MKRIPLVSVVTSLVSALALSGPVLGQEAYPSKPIRLITPTGPGGTTDILARLFGAKLTEVFKQQVLVENRGSASGVMAGEMTAKAPADGYTLMLAGDSLIVINPHIYSRMPFDTPKDLVPVTSIASNQFFLSVNPSVPAKTLPEFVEYARKANPPLP